MFGFDLMVGGALFWLLLIAVMVLCEISAVNETHWGFAWLFVFSGILWWGFNANPVTWAFHNFGTFCIYSGIYLVAGMGWGFAKWWFHVKNARDVINSRPSLKTEYTIKQASTTPFDGTFTDYLTDRGYIPVAMKNKEKISVWMFWWPFSMFWTFFDDFLRRMYNLVIEKYMFIFDRINNVVFGDLNK